MATAATAAAKKATSSAARQARSSERKRLHNQSVKSSIRSHTRQFIQLLKDDPKNAPLQGRRVVSLLDRAAKNRVFHKNTTRRYKARIMAKIQTVLKSN